MIFKWDFEIALVLQCIEIFRDVRIRWLYFALEMDVNLQEPEGELY